MNVVCYGDSNTYGYDPRSYFSGRYEAQNRWVDLLAKKTGWTIRNEGMNGREIPGCRVSFPQETELLVVMLGTNDLLQGADADTTAKRMEIFLAGVNLPRDRILLIAPPSMRFGAWVTEERLVDASAELAEAYQILAQRIGTDFADAGEWNVSLAFDGVHFTEDGHRAFAEKLFQKLLASFDQEIPNRGER